MNFFGIHLLTGGPQASPEHIRSGSVLAENLGYEAICLEDHIVMPKIQQSPYPYISGGKWPKTDVIFFELLTTLSYVAGITHKSKLMTHALVVPYRDAVLTAKMLSTMDQLSGGRLILAVGVGWNEDEFKLLGHDYFHQRGRVTDEFIRIFKELWTNEDPQLTGHFRSVTGIAFYPKPVQQPHPPIWVGGWSNSAIRRAAALGDVWFPTGFRRRSGLAAGNAPTPSDFQAARIPYLHQELEKVKRPPQSVELGFTTDVIFADASSANERQWFIGNSEQIASDFRQYQEVGVKYFVVTFPCETHEAMLEAMERFSAEVRPFVGG